MNKSSSDTMSLEVMRLLDVEHDDLGNVKKYSQFKSVVDYFENMPDWRHQMLKLMSKGKKDNLKRMWDWVQLQREKESKLVKLDPSLFAEDIEEEIKNKYISRDGLERARRDVTKRRQDVEMRERMREQSKVLKEQRHEKESQVTESGVEASKLLETEKTLNDIKSINNLLEEYE